MAKEMIATVAQQKDNLCGPFCASRILGVSQDLVAVRAGTTLPTSAAEPSVPRGARSITDYSYDLPQVEEAESGTSAAGLVEAIESLSNGNLKVVPVRGEWTASRVALLVEGAPLVGARLIANVRTGKLWGSHPTAEQLLAEVRGDEPEGPPSEWDVGHFVELQVLARLLSGSLVVVHDTYPTLGLDGHHLQPPRAVAAALVRGDGREGGVLMVVPRENAVAATTLATGLGLEVGVWNNGSRSQRHGDR